MVVSRPLRRLVKIVWANLLKAIVALGGILKLFEKAWDKTQVYIKQKKKDKRDSVIRQLEQARLEGDSDKVRKLHIRLRALNQL